MSSPNATVPTNKIFLMDKYFEEMQRSWRDKDSKDGGPEEVHQLRGQMKRINQEMSSIRTIVSQSESNTSQTAGTHRPQDGLTTQAAASATPHETPGSPRDDGNKDTVTSSQHHPFTRDRPPSLRRTGSNAHEHRSLASNTIRGSGRLKSGDHRERLPATLKSPVVSRSQKTTTTEVTGNPRLPLAHQDNVFTPIQGPPSTPHDSQGMAQNNLSHGHGIIHNPRPLPTFTQNNLSAADMSVRTDKIPVQYSSSQDNTSLMQRFEPSHAVISPDERPSVDIKAVIQRFEPARTSGKGPAPTNIRFTNHSSVLSQFKQPVNETVPSNTYVNLSQTGLVTEKGSLNIDAQSNDKPHSNQTKTLDGSSRQDPSRKEPHSLPARVGLSDAHGSLASHRQDSLSPRIEHVPTSPTPGGRYSCRPSQDHVRAILQRGRHSSLITTPVSPPPCLTRAPLPPTLAHGYTTTSHGASGHPGGLMSNSQPPSLRVHADGTITSTPQRAPSASLSSNMASSASQSVGQQGMTVSSPPGVRRSLPQFQYQITPVSANMTRVSALAQNEHRAPNVSAACQTQTPASHPTDGAAENAGRNSAQTSPRRPRKSPTTPRSPQPAVYENECMFRPHIYVSDKDIRNSYGASNLTMFAALEDLIHLPGPVTEDVVLKTLQARFYAAQYYTRIGPVLVTVNPHTHIPGPRTLADDSVLRQCPHLLRMLREAAWKQMETGQSQVFILDGISGSGKTYTSHLLLRQLFDIAGGGAETDTFKHLRATFTVLRSFGCASTIANPESTRMGYFIENHVTDGAIFRTKIHCYFLDQARIVRPPARERNYHIFYQILAGLPAEELAKYQLDAYSPYNLAYLSSGECVQNETQNRQRFEAWKAALSVLGIPFSDILRLLAAILLLGNIHFAEGNGLELEVSGNNEIKSVGTLLGVSPVSLYRGLTTRTQKVRGQVFKSLSDSIAASQTRDALARSLFTRTIAAIVKRANSCKRPNSNSTLSNDGSNDSSNAEGVNGSAENGPLLGNQSRGPSLNHSPQSLTSNNSGSSFIGILDMFGFEDSQCNELEQICTNLCAETLQHFYNTHIFVGTQQACEEEQIQSDIYVMFFDNAPIIDLLSSQTGLLSMLDAECSLQHGGTESYLHKVRMQHKMNKHFFESVSQEASHEFGIVHYAGKVLYDASDFLTTNRDCLSDDIISIFGKHNCSFGFITHLFSHELKVIQDSGDGAKGLQFRISPPVPLEVPSVEHQTTVSWDFHARLDSLLQVLVHSQPHFIRCIKSNSEGQPEMFEREMVKAQVRSLQLLETVHLMTAGFPHRMRYSAFNSRFRLLLTKHDMRTNTEKPYEQSKMILDHFSHTIDQSKQPCHNVHWALGKKHIFFSEAARQHLEQLRVDRQVSAATLIQANWRRRICRKKWPLLKRQLQVRKRERERARDHSPVRRPPTLRRNSMCEQRDLQRNAVVNHVDHRKSDQSTVQQTLNIYGLDMDTPPPIPASRLYTVSGNVKLGYPQMRVMKQNFSDMSSSEVLVKGQEIKVVGASAKRGYLLVEGRSGNTINVPYKITEIKLNTPAFGEKGSERKTDSSDDKKKQHVASSRH